MKESEKCQNVVNDVPVPAESKPSRNYLESESQPVILEAQFTRNQQTSTNFGPSRSGGSDSKDMFLQEISLEDTDFDIRDHFRQKNKKSRQKQLKFEVSGQQKNISDFDQYKLDLQKKKTSNGNISQKQILYVLDMGSDGDLENHMSTKNKSGTPQCKDLEARNDRSRNQQHKEKMSQMTQHPTTYKSIKSKRYIPFDSAPDAHSHENLRSSYSHQRECFCPRLTSSMTSAPKTSKPLKKRNQSEESPLFHFDRGYFKHFPENYFDKK